MLPKEKYQLFEEDEYAKLGFDEKDLSSSWGFWNPSSDSFRNPPLKKDRPIL
jgi:hypothetical protein